MPLGSSEVQSLCRAFGHQPDLAHPSPVPGGPGPLSTPCSPDTHLGDCRVATEAAHLHARFRRELLEGRGFAISAPPGARTLQAHLGSKAARHRVSKEASRLHRPFMGGGVRAGEMQVPAGQCSRPALRAAGLRPESQVFPCEHPLEACSYWGRREHVQGCGGGGAGGEEGPLPRLPSPMPCWAEWWVGDARRGHRHAP